jgi:hypothetical protein
MGFAELKYASSYNICISRIETFNASTKGDHYLGGDQWKEASVTRARFGCSAKSF